MLSFLRELLVVSCCDLILLLIGGLRLCVTTEQTFTTLTASTGGMQTSYKKKMHLSSSHYKHKRATPCSKCPKRLFDLCKFRSSPIHCKSEYKHNDREEITSVTQSPTAGKV